VLLQQQKVFALKGYFRTQSSENGCTVDSPASTVRPVRSPVQPVNLSISLCVCVCVCEREREREREITPAEVN